MSSTLTFAQMADLALGTPEVGAVNFNVLHNLMHSIIRQLAIGDCTTEIRTEDKEFLANKEKDGKTSQAPYHQLQSKVAYLEKQLIALNELPTNETLYDRVRQGEGERPTPVSDMWQAMQLKNKVKTNEDTISKLTSMMEDLMRQLGDVKKDVDSAMKKLGKQKDGADKKDVDDLKLQLKDGSLDGILDRLKDIDDILADHAQHFVDWEALENYLQGMRDTLSDLQEATSNLHLKTPSPARSASPASKERSPERPDSRDDRAKERGSSGQKDSREKDSSSRSKGDGSKAKVSCAQFKNCSIN